MEWGGENRGLREVWPESQYRLLSYRAKHRRVTWSYMSRAQSSALMTDSKHLFYVKNDWLNYYDNLGYPEPCGSKCQEIQNQFIADPQPGNSSSTLALPPHPQFGSPAENKTDQPPEILQHTTVAHLLIQSFFPLVTERALLCLTFGRYRLICVEFQCDSEN